MNQVLVFVGLKVAEIAGLCVAGYGFYRIGHLIVGNVMDHSNPFDRFMCAMVGLSITLVAIAVTWMVCQLLVANWQWAGTLVTKG